MALTEHHHRMRVPYVSAERITQMTISSSNDMEWKLNGTAGLFAEEITKLLGTIGVESIRKLPDLSNAVLDDLAEPLVESAQEILFQFIGKEGAETVHNDLRYTIRNAVMLRVLSEFYANDIPFPKLDKPIEDKAVDAVLLYGFAGSKERGDVILAQLVESGIKTNRELRTLYDNMLKVVPFKCRDQFKGADPFPNDPRSLEEKFRSRASQKYKDRFPSNWGYQEFLIIRSYLKTIFPQASFPELEIP